MFKCNEFTKLHDVKQNLQKKIRNQTKKFIFGMPSSVSVRL